MEENKNISLGLGDVSWSEDLGSYYIDMRPALIHYGPENIWDGEFDEDGIPMIRQDGYLIYFPVNIAQYGFMIHSEWKETGRDEDLKLMVKLARKLISLKSEKDATYVWWHQHRNERYGIEAPWASAMAQGEIISFFLRVHQATRDDSWLESAKKTANFLKFDVKQGGVQRLDQDGNPWLEEFPSEIPSLVLNGFIYAVFGLIDLYRVTRSENWKKELDGYLNSIEKNLEKYDCGYWSIYDQQKKELVRYYYQKNVHIPQMEVLFQLTGKEIYRKYAIRWKKQLNALNYALVQIMYRIRPRLLNLRRFK